MKEGIGFILIMILFAGYSSQNFFLLIGIIKVIENKNNGKKHS